MDKTYIITKHDISSAYSCLNYLANTLSKDMEIKIWSCTERKNMNRLQKNNFSFLNCWYGNVKGIRLFFIYIHVFLLMIKKNTNIILNDIDFFPLAYIAKKLYPHKKFILYHTEIYGEDVKTFKFIENFYKKHADFPDLIIECLKERAEYRAKTYSIKKKIYVINNTLPLMEENYVGKQERVSDRIIFFYAGGCNLERELGTLIKELSLVNNVYFLAYCYGSDNEINEVNSLCSKYLKNSLYSVNKAIPREELFEVMRNVDVGLVYYDPKLSVNHYYAAPSKFFEYISCGLNVVSTNNEGINRIIEQDEIGVCIKEGETISEAINRLLSKGLKNKNEIRKLFENKYCYEIDSTEAILAIKKELIKK